MQRLQDSELRYRRLFEAAQDGILILDAKTGMIEDVNPFLINMLGYSREEFVEKKLWEVGAFKDIEASRNAFEALQQNKYIRYEGLPLKAKDGRLVQVEFVSNVYRVDKTKVIQCNIRDVTERKQAEVEMRQRLSELELLYQSGLAFNQLMNPQVIAEKMIELLDQKMDWHHTAIRLYRPESETLELLAFNLPNLKGRKERNAAEKRFEIIQRPEQGLSGWVIRNGQALRSNDLKNDSRYIASFPGLQSGLYVPIKIGERVIGTISIESEQADAFSESDERLAMTLATQAASAIDNALLVSDLQYSNIELALTYDATIEGWSRALDLRDKETEGHSQRVAEMTLRLARSMGIDEEELVHVRRGALLHDIGKMGVPDSILLKPGLLTDEEWVVMKKHPIFAYELLFPIRYLRLALDLPYCHHEKWDGSGYPRGIKGAEIPLAARIFAVVDVWDALNSDRPYRSAWAKAKVRKHIRALSGTHFDPQVVNIFLQNLKKAPQPAEAHTPRPVDALEQALL